MYACKGLYSHPLLLSPPSPFSFCSEFSTGTFGCRYAATAAGCQNSAYTGWNTIHCGSGGTGCKLTTLTEAFNPDDTGPDPDPPPAENKHRRGASVERPADGSADDPLCGDEAADWGDKDPAAGEVRQLYGDEGVEMGGS